MCPSVLGAEERGRNRGHYGRANLIVVAETEAAISLREDRESECNREALEDGVNRVSGVISSLQWGRLLRKPLTCLF